MQWIAPHPDMAFAPIPGQRAMAKIIRADGKFTLYRQDDTGMTPIGTYATLAEAKTEAGKLS